ncbi:hypothetical protein JCM8547_009255 [Rhodosporidiobolus lusitaniae]
MFALFSYIFASDCIAPELIASEVTAEPAVNTPRQFTPTSSIYAAPTSNLVKPKSAAPNPLTSAARVDVLLPAATLKKRSPSRSITLLRQIQSASTGAPSPSLPAAPSTSSSRRRKQKTRRDPSAIYPSGYDPTSGRRWSQVQRDLVQQEVAEFLLHREQFIAQLESRRSSSSSSSSGSSSSSSLRSSSSSFSTASLSSAHAASADLRKPRSQQRFTKLSDLLLVDGYQLPLSLSSFSSHYNNTMSAETIKFIKRTRRRTEQRERREREVSAASSLSSSSSASTPASSLASTRSSRSSRKLRALEVFSPSLYEREMRVW